jgi:RNA ligase (TIGR02306 family)
MIVIDTILPDAPWSEFLKDAKRPDAPIRLRTVKLRGEYSQGLVLPLSVLPEHMRSWQDGADVGGELGVKKYEKELPMSLSGVAKGAFPQHIAAKTDEDNGLSNPDLVARVLAGGVVVTLKLDGSSCTVLTKDGAIADVCSRNLSIVQSETNALWKAALALSLPERGDWIIQGELMGPGVQGNQLGLDKPTLYIFQMRETGTGWMSDVIMRCLAAVRGFNVVPKVAEGRFTIDEIQAIADAQKLPDGRPAEGIVVRPVGTPTSGIGRPLGFKIINRNYGE